jgi:hypothetical protein
MTDTFVSNVERIRQWQAEHPGECGDCYVNPGLCDEHDLGMVPTTPANPAAPKPRCRRHDWAPAWEDPEFDAARGAPPAVFCLRCDAVRDPAKARRGRLNRSRGNAIEREIGKRLGLRRVGQYGEKTDLSDARFVAQVKSGPSYYSTRVESELDALPANADQTPLYIAASTPGPGNKRRVYVTVGLGDLVKLVGPHAQVSMWVDEWIAVKEGLDASS